MKFDATYRGAVMQGTNVYVYTIRSDGKFAGTNIDGTTTRVTLTGYTEVSLKGNTHYQTTGGKWIYIPDGWQKVGTQAIYGYSQAQAQKLVDTIIANNKTILRCNLLCARFANKLTEDERAEVRALQNRLTERNEALQKEGLTTNIYTASYDGWSELAPYLDRLMSGEGVGIATWAVVVIAATVIAATATAAYFAYKSLADESEKDVKFSKELTETLMSKLTDEEYQQLINETKGIVTKSKIRQIIKDYSKVISVVGIIAGGYLLYKFIRNEL